MHQIVYSSRARVAFSKEDLVRLCRNCVESNNEVGVTGLLLYDGACFLQAIEGDREAVVGVMRRIVGDPRHGSIDYITNGPVDRRRFGQWGMEIKEAASGCCSREFLEKVKEDVTLVDDAALQATFIGFASLATNRPVGYRCSIV